MRSRLPCDEVVIPCGPIVWPRVRIATGYDRGGDDSAYQAHHWNPVPLPDKRTSHARQIIRLTGTTFADTVRVFDTGQD